MGPGSRVAPAGRGRPQPSSVLRRGGEASRPGAAPPAAPAADQRRPAERRQPRTAGLHRVRGLGRRRQGGRHQAPGRATSTPATCTWPRSARPRPTSCGTTSCGASGRRCPGGAGMAIFDRSWYGRVLVERVENLATEAQWRRAYEEITDFEHSLAEEGMVVIKLWMHMSARGAVAPVRAPAATIRSRLEADRRGLAQPGEAAAVRRGGGRHAGPHPRSPGALGRDPGGEKRNGRVEVIETVIRRMEDGHAARGASRYPVTGAAIRRLTAPTRPGIDPTARAPRAPDATVGAREHPARSGITIPFDGIPWTTTARGSSAWSSSGTPTCGRPRSTGPTASLRSPWPPPGRPTCASAWPSPRPTPGGRPCWPRAWPPWPTPPPGASPSGSAPRRRSSWRTGTAWPSRDPTAASATRCASCAPPSAARRSRSTTRPSQVKGSGWPAPGRACRPSTSGALRPGMLRLAGREADGAILNWLAAEDVATSRGRGRAGHGDRGPDLRRAPPRTPRWPAPSAGG